MGKQARSTTREARQTQLQAQAAARRKSRIQVMTGVGAAIIAALVITIVAVVATSGGKGSRTPQSAGAGAGSGTAAAAVSPSNASTNGAILVGRPDAPVKLEVYLDYMCPYCGHFERANGDEISRLTAAGKVRLELHPLAFLDQQSGNSRYSTRAADALATVADKAPASVLAFNQALYAQQPAEGSAGLSDDQIATLATKAGVAPDVVKTFTNRTFEGWVAAATQAALTSGGITGTPTVKINGTVFKGDLYTVGPLTRAIEAAGGK